MCVEILKRLPLWQEIWKPISDQSNGTRWWTWESLCTYIPLHPILLMICRYKTKETRWSKGRQLLLTYKLITCSRIYSDGAWMQCFSFNSSLHSEDTYDTCPQAEAEALFLAAKVANLLKFKQVAFLSTTSHLQELQQPHRWHNLMSHGRSGRS
jgi:hypothetical protein